MLQNSVNAGKRAPGNPNLAGGGMEVLPPALRNNLWQPGQSGNPGGKRGRFQQLQSMAREASPQALAKLIEMIGDPEPRVAGWAADKVLERAYGKPKDYDPRDEQNGGTAIDPAQFTPEVRALIMQALRLLVEAQPMQVIEEPPEPVEKDAP